MEKQPMPGEREAQQALEESARMILKGTTDKEHARERATSLERLTAEEPTKEDKTVENL